MELILAQVRRFVRQNIMSQELCTVLWLVPGEPARAFFRATIQRLAQELNAPVFEPHLTLGFGSPEQVQEIDTAAIKLPVSGLAWSEQFTKTLFLRCRLTAPLAQLRSSLGMESLGFDPHLSLLYRTMPVEEKESRAATITVPFPSVTFDRVVAVRCPAETKSRDDVEKWEEVNATVLRP
jgi:hypothetical protein